jgi:SAM-dependent methyltransferase
MEYDRIKDRLESVLGKYPLLRSGFFALMNRLFLRSRYVAKELTSLRRCGLDPKKILDAGSGFGQYSFRLARIFPKAQVLGVDTKSELVESGNRYASRRGISSVRFQVNDLTALPFENEFDLVLSVDVMEHIEEDRRVLANISRSLKKGGYFLMTTPYVHHPLQREEVFVEEHVRAGYTRDETLEKFSEAGLEVRRFIITYGPWGDCAWRLLQRLPMSWLRGRIWLMPLILVYLAVVYPIAWVCMQCDLHRKNRRGGGILVVAVKCEPI